MDDYTSLQDQALKRKRKLLVTLAGVGLGLLVIVGAVSWRSGVNKKRREQQVLALLEPLAEKLRAHPDGFFSPSSQEYCYAVANLDAALDNVKNLKPEEAEIVEKLNQRRKASLWNQEQADLAPYNEALALSYDIYQKVLNLYTTAGMSTEKMNAEVRPLLSSKIGDFATLLDLDKRLRDQHPAFRRVASALGILICHEQEMLELIGSRMRYAEIRLVGWEAIANDPAKIENLRKGVRNMGIPYFPVILNGQDSSWLVSSASSDSWQLPETLVQKGVIKGFVLEDTLDGPGAELASALRATIGLPPMAPGTVYHQLMNHPETNQEMLDAINKDYSAYRSLLARFKGSKPATSDPNTLVFPHCTVTMGPLDYRSHPRRRGLEGFRSVVFDFPLRPEESASKVDSEEVHKTRYGTLTVKSVFPDHTLLLFNGKAINKLEGNAISLDSVFRLGNADVIVAKTSFWGNAVDGTGIMLITVGPGGTTRVSPMFADAEAKNESRRTIKRDGDKIVITASKGLNKGDDLFVYQNGVVTQDGKPVK